MRHPTVPVPGTATRILSAAFIAAALALLLLLSASGQATFDRTDGKISIGGLSVGVFADIRDAQLAKNRETTYDGETVYLPALTPPTGPTLGSVAGSLSTMDTAYLANGLAAPQNSFFGGTLWVSNDPAAYNTILITAASTSVETDGDCVVATVRNPRADSSITVQMALSTSTGPPGQLKSYYQAFVRVLDSQALDANGDPLYTSSDGPLCTAYPAGVAHADTAAILARHDDRLVIEVEGAGQVTVDVDGEGPDVTGIMPEDQSYLRSNTLRYSFVVRDNDAGLRHDGESVITQDGDYTEVNRDDDHATTGEPLSTPSGGQISVNGEAAEIDLKVWAEKDDPNAADDITEIGSWTLLGDRPGVAYAFSADAAGMDEGAYFMEITATDRAGNRTVSEAPDDEYPGPHAFTVDDTDPATVESWTGIAYDPDLEMMGKVVGGEVADRSWIMVELTEPVRPGIDSERIRVADHEVVSVYQPNYAPPFMRTVLGRTSNPLPRTQRLMFASSAPRAGTRSAPQAQTCADTLDEDVRISGLNFAYSSTTGDTTISWNRLSTADCGGYRLGILAGRRVLLVEDLSRTTSSFSIPRGSELGRYIEADVGDADGDDLTILVALRHASVGSGTDRFGRRTATATVDLAGLTAPTSAVTGGVVAPFLLHPASAPAVLPAVRADDTSLLCRFTNSDPPHDEVVLSFTHRPATIGGWTLAGYYRQLFYPPDYNVGLDRLFEYTAVGADGFETSGSFQHYYNSSPQVYNAKAEVVAVYEKDGRRLAGAVRTVGCTGSSLTNPNVDRSPPLLQTAAVGGTTLRLTYNEGLDGGSTPATNAFEVLVDGEQRTVSDVSVIGWQVVLTLGSPVAAGERVTVSYTKPGTDPVQDVAGNDAFSFRLWPVSNALGGGNSAFALVNAVDITGLTHEEALAEAGYWPIDINRELIEDTRTRIYIELARELMADETPEVTIFAGGALDLAGNASATEAITPSDGIAPRFTVTVTATAQDRPVANARGKYVVDVRADEDLRRRPTVYFTGIAAGKVTVQGADAYAYDIGELRTGHALTAQDDDAHWAGTYPASGFTDLGELFGLVVYGFDYEDNIGESGGWTPPRHQRTPEIGPPEPDDALDLAKMHEAGVLLELDDGFNGGATPGFALNPTRRQRNDETESSAPIVSISFPAEEDEYAVCPENGCGEANGNPDAEFFDSHATVTIAAITLDGSNALGQLTRVNASEFALLASDLALGEHEVEYMAVDDAGNVATFEFTFSVVEREPYELDVLPGWNLISFPGTPMDPSLGGVIPSGARVSPVLAYQDGDWLTAVVNDEGEWGGNLTRFEAGFGYWLFTTTYATLNPLIPEHEQSATPPTAPVRHGWNLLGVIDIFQNPAGAPPGPNGGDGEADNYFGSIPWRIAYGYDTARSLWVRSIPGADRTAPDGTTADERGFRTVDGKVVTQEVLNGKGYWIWSAEPGTLVP
ncbi:MAG: hypothetical protein F4Y25_00230 [Chloroflexi bacterium]|nr:hypothetical protein [Chloroflexota bacterium]